MNWLEAISELKLPPLVSGNHDGGPTHGLCAMEMVAFMERLEHTDRPECTCPAIRDFVIATNDILKDEERQKLLPVLPELVDTVVEGHVMREREQFIMNAATRAFEYAYRGRCEYDYERDRMRHSYSRHRSQEEARYLLANGVKGAVRVLSKVSPPFQLADILIGILRDTLKIGATQPKTQFAEPERVEELAKITYLSHQEKFEQKAQVNPVNFNYGMPYQVLKHKSVFKFDCMV